jgi:hypothetical protein
VLQFRDVLSLHRSYAKEQTTDFLEIEFNVSHNLWHNAIFAFIVIIDTPRIVVLLVVDCP